MTVYVDDFLVPAKVGAIDARWSHLLADTEEELVEFARRLGLKPGWIQHPGKAEVHFDVTDSVRQKAIAAGAKPITILESGEILRQRRAAIPAAAQDAVVVEQPPASDRARRYNPTLQRHWWEKTREHWYRCHWCRLIVNNRPDTQSRRWFKEWTWPDGVTGDNYQGGGVPKCPGPERQPSG